MKRLAALLSAIVLVPMSSLAADRSITVPSAVSESRLLRLPRPRSRPDAWIRRWWRSAPIA
jgi:hypothetical protein